MSTFYKGNGVRNMVIEHYFDGFVMENGQKVPLRNAASKYNIEFINRVNKLNTEFYTIMVAEKIAIKLMKINENCYYGEVNNLWNLIKSQSGTIRYNKLLKKSLKKYIVDKQIVYTNIRKDLEKQDDRVARNSKLVIDLLKDYGLAHIIELVEKENNISFFEHIKAYTDEIGKTLNFGTNNDNDEEVKAYYESIENAYIDYLKQLADKHNLSLNCSISDHLEKHRQMVESKKQQYKEEKSLVKEAELNKQINDALNNDNITLSRELNCDRFGKLTRFTRETITETYAKIKEVNYKVWYVAVCKYSKVEYLSVKGNLTSGITRIKWFRSEKEALQAIKDNSHLFNNGTIVKAFSITLLAELRRLENSRNVLENLKQTTPKITKNTALQTEMNSLDSDYKYYVSDILKKYNGFNFENSQITLYFYKVRTIRDSIPVSYYLNLNNGINTVNDIKDATFFIERNMKLKTELQQNLGNNYVVYEEVIEIDSELYKSKVRESDMRYRMTLKKLTGESFNTMTEAQIKHVYKVRQMLNTFKERGCKEVYFIIILEINSRSESIYYTNKNPKVLRTSKLELMTFFDSITDANNMALEINNGKYSYLAFVKSIQL